MALGKISQLRKDNSGISWTGNKNCFPSPSRWNSRTSHSSRFSLCSCQATKGLAMDSHTHHPQWAYLFHTVHTWHLTIIPTLFTPRAIHPLMLNSNSTCQKVFPWLVSSPSRILLRTALCFHSTPLASITLNCNNWSAYLSFQFHRDCDYISLPFPHSLKHKVHSTNVQEWTWFYHHEQMIESRHEGWEKYVLILLSPHQWKTRYRESISFSLFSTLLLTQGIKIKIRRRLP